MTFFQLGGGGGGNHSVLWTIDSILSVGTQLGVQATHSPHQHLQAYHNFPLIISHSTVLHSLLLDLALGTVVVEPSDRIQRVDESKHGSD